MKNKIKSILLAVFILSLLALVIFGGNKKPEETINETVIPTITLAPTSSKPRYSDETGAIYISPTEKEFDEIKAIKRIRDNSPIETDSFKVYFDYEDSVIAVEFKNKENGDNVSLFEEWKKDNGYKLIEDQYWKIKE